MKQIRTLVRLGCALLVISLAAFGQKPDCSLVPGWTQDGPARNFVADNLFEYMDGNAEGYLIYRFAKMDGVNCKSGDDTVIFDISEFADAESAYGMFSANRDPREPMTKLGTGGQIVPRRAIFVKDKYYVEVGISRDGADVLRAFCTTIEKKIQGSTEIPPQIGWFPQEKLVPESTRLIPESVLGLRLLKRGYVAQYEYGKAFLVTEESPQAAGDVMTKLRARFGEVKPAKVADDAFEVADKYLGRLCFFRKGQYLAGYAGLAEGQDPVALSTALATRIP
jgi:hypothetical protein